MIPSVIIAMLSVISLAIADPVQITSTNFVEHFGCELNSFQSSPSHDKWFVMFYAPWCTHCKKTKPIFTQMSNQSKQIKFGMVDCTVQKELCRYFAVKGFPALIIITENRRAFKYTGTRTKQNLTQFISGSNFELNQNCQEVKINPSYLDEMWEIVSFHWGKSFLMFIVAPVLIGFLFSKCLDVILAKKQPPKAEKEKQK